ncbi:Berberine bridge enzyme-like 2 [Linum grandiflorum]
MNRPTNLLLPVTFLLLLLLSSAPPSLAADAVYDSFLRCLQTNTPPQDRISDLVYSPSNQSFTSVLQAYIRNSRLNTTTTPKPSIIITPTKISHVQAAVICTKAAGFQLKIRSGGHDYEGVSYVSNSPFFILDMFNLRGIQIDAADQSGWVQAGATLGELYYAISRKSNLLAFPAGVCPTVGVGGHLSGGGYGNLLRKYGLSVDHIVDAQIVDANGKFLDSKAAMGEDLFWAIRGGGGASFGVVITYKIKLVPVPATVTVFRVEKYLEQNATDMVYQWQFVAPKTTNDLFMRMLLQPVSSKTKKGSLTVRASILAEYLGNADTLVALMSKEFPELGLKKSDCLEMSWIDSVLWWGLDNAKNPEALTSRVPESVNFGKRKSDYVQTPISKPNLEWIWKKMVESGKTGFVFNPYGGRMDEIAATETPFPHRKGNLWKIQFSIGWKEAGETAEKDFLSQIRRIYSYMTPFVSKNPRGAYLNYRDLDIGTGRPGKDSYAEGKVYGEKYFGVNFERLVKVKTAVDPSNFFWNEQSIPVLPRSSRGTRRNGFLLVVANLAPLIVVVIIVHPGL